MKVKNFKIKVLLESNKVVQKIKGKIVFNRVEKKVIEILNEEIQIALIVYYLIFIHIYFEIRKSIKERNLLKI